MTKRILMEIFSEEEIDMVIKSLPNNHAPGPNGFNGLFIKKCWDIVKNDFTRLFRDFGGQNVDLTSINSSVTTLIPKKQNHELVNDNIPISLLNLFSKMYHKATLNEIIESDHANSTQQPIIWFHQWNNLVGLSCLVFLVLTSLSPFKEGSCHSKARL